MFEGVRVCVYKRVSKQRGYCAYARVFVCVCVCVCVCVYVCVTVSCVCVHARGIERYLHVEISVFQLLLLDHQ